MGDVTVRCPFCGGRGCVPLSPEYHTTLCRLRELGGERSGAELARDMGVKPTAMNNRLVALERHGLVTSRRAGRKRFFAAKEQP